MLQMAVGCFDCVLQSSYTEHLGERLNLLLGKPAHRLFQPSAPFLGKCALEDLIAQQAELQRSGEDGQWHSEQRAGRAVPLVLLRLNQQG